MISYECNVAECFMSWKIALVPFNEEWYETNTIFQQMKYSDTIAQIDIHYLLYTTPF